MAQTSPKKSKPKSKPKPKAIQRLKVTHVSLMPDGKFELGVQRTVAVRKKPATAAKPPPKAKS